MRISDWSSDVCSSDLGDAPESTFDDRAALLTHPDFDMLADISADEAAARDPGFHAWLAAGARVPDIAPEGDAAASVVAADADAPTATEDAPCACRRCVAAAFAVGRRQIGRPPVRDHVGHT